VVFSLFHTLYLSAEKVIVLTLTADSDIAYVLSLSHPLLQSPMLSQCVTCSAWNSKDSYDTASEFFVVRFNGVTSLTS
jgi:hypothetical protein